MNRFVVTTGPESTGKTTLATQLSDRLCAPLVTEISREYLTEQLTVNPDFQYSPEDLLHIAKQQHLQECRLAELDPGIVICDTDLLVMKIWSEMKYGNTEPWIEDTFTQIIQQGVPRHYLLCDWNIPWQPDPLRESPHDREELFERYRKTLDENRLPYTIVTGNEQHRLNQAVMAIE